MWAIRILNGPQAGQIVPLKPGQHRIGRATTCDVKIASTSVSKEHATFFVTEDKMIITDLNSRNGTFVNGVRVQNQRLNLGDKISLHDVMLDVLKVADNVTRAQPNYGFSGQTGVSVSRPNPPAWAGNAAVQLPPQQDFGHQAYPDLHASHGDPHAQSYGHGAESPEAPPAQRMSAGSISDLFYNFKVYIDNVAMPGIYSIAQQMPYRYAIAALVAVYVVVVTSLSIIPIVATTKKNIQAESIRRARTIARGMRDMNKKFIVERNEMSVDVRAAELEEGVTAAFIINAKEGTVIAPANKRGEFANKPFVNQARREEREVADFIDDSVVGVAVPIGVYSAESGNQSIAAYAIVLYDTGALAMNGAQVFSLFIQTLVIALLGGAVLFFFLYKVVEQPIEAANQQVDDALREGRDDVSTDYRYPALENLISNINSALSRIGRAGGESPMAVVGNRDVEAMNIVRMLTTPAVAVNAVDERVISTNSSFDRLVGGGVNLQGRPLTDIPDVALQQNLGDLLPRMRASFGEIALSEIPFPDARYEVCGQAVMGSTEPAYYLITLNRSGGDS